MFDTSKLGENNGGEYKSPEYLGLADNPKYIINPNELDLTTNDGLKKYIDYKFQKLDERIDKLIESIDSENTQMKKEIEEIEYIAKSAKSLAICNS